MGAVSRQTGEYLRDVGKDMRPTKAELDEARRAFAALRDSAALIPGHARPSPMPGTLYTVTTLSAHRVYGGERTIGIFTEFLDAEQIVRRNVFDIWEFTYDLVVIEEVRANEMYGGFAPRRRWWFRWVPREDGDWGKGGYQPCKVPAGYETICGWGIG